MPTRRFGDGGSRSGEPVRVQELLRDTALQHVFSLVDFGALVAIGTTSDGGALMCQVTFDGKWDREYFREEVPFVMWLEEEAGLVENELAQTPPPPSAQRGPRARQNGRGGRGRRNPD